MEIDVSETCGQQMRGIPAGDETACGERWPEDGPRRAPERPVLARRRAEPAPGPRELLSLRPGHAN